MSEETKKEKNDVGVKEDVVVKAKDLQILIDKITMLESGGASLKEEIVSRNKTATLAIIGDEPAYVVKMSPAVLMVNNETREQRDFVDITDHTGKLHEKVDLGYFLLNCGREVVEIIKGSAEVKEFFAKQSMVEVKEVKPGDWRPTPSGETVPAGYVFRETTVEVKTELAGTIRVPVDCLNIVGARKREEVVSIDTSVKTY